MTSTAKCLKGAVIFQVATSGGELYLLMEHAFALKGQLHISPGQSGVAFAEQRRPGFGRRNRPSPVRAGQRRHYNGPELLVVLD